jgi:hypothetical protein
VPVTHVHLSSVSYFEQATDMHLSSVSHLKQTADMHLSRSVQLLHRLYPVLGPAKQRQIKQPSYHLIRICAGDALAAPAAPVCHGALSLLLIEQAALRMHRMAQGSVKHV